MSDLSQLSSDLSHPDVSRRRQAAERLAHLGAEARGAAVPLSRACDDEDEEVRQWAAEALEGLGPPDIADGPALAEIACDLRRRDAAYWAATLLGRLGKRGAFAGDSLAKALCEHPTLAVRERAAWALGQVGPSGQQARSALEQASQDVKNIRLSRLAQEALANWAKAAESDRSP
jgi:HEAT repeat protein